MSGRVTALTTVRLSKYPDFMVQENIVILSMAGGIDHKMALAVIDEIVESNELISFIDLSMWSY